tara:strand:+ start:2741 stop:3247 length:507 start_codon:yes stop_codon:yes gene_type:complete
MTATEWLIEQLPLIQQEGLRDVWEQAKEMEKQQIIDAYIQGREDNHLDYYPQKHSEEYYTSTYGSKGSDGKCPNCGAMEVDAMSPRTVYECGSSDYDQRPNTFKQSDKCKELTTSSQTETPTKELENFLEWIEEETHFKHGTTRLTAQPTKLYTHKELVKLYNQEKYK